MKYPKKWKQTIIKSSATLKHAVESLNKSALKIVLIVDEDNKFIGTIVDGDIRRALLRGLSLENNILQVVNKDSLTVNDKTASSDIYQLMKKNKIQQIPVINEKRKLVGLEVDDILRNEKSLDNDFIIMAGGRGKRLKPLTNRIPKPMIEVRGKPIIDHIIHRAIDDGFKKFTISVNYLSHIIKNHLGDGNKLGVTIKYIEESEPLGTAGSLSLLSTNPKRNIVISNGDVLTNINYSDMLEFHTVNQADATMAVSLFEWGNPYGVVTLDGILLKSFEEKPTSNFLVNAGMYVLSPNALSQIPKQQYLDMPFFLDTLKTKGYKVVAFPTHESWLDIGKPEDLKKTRG